MSFDPEGKMVVVGTTVGRFVVLNAFSGQHMASIQVAGDQIDAIRFSPGGCTEEQLMRAKINSNYSKKTLSNFIVIYRNLLILLSNNYHLTKGKKADF